MNGIKMKLKNHFRRMNQRINVSHFAKNKDGEATATNSTGETQNSEKSLG
jgi:hypothetical protein